MSDLWEITAIKYAERNSRTRADSFIMDDHPAATQGMDYFVWMLANPISGQQILVDTGYDAAEAKLRGRDILRDPREALLGAGFNADVEDIIVTHLHYDHAGGLHLFPNATLHVQAAEAAFATGPCMCEDHLRMPFTAEHVCEFVRRLYASRVKFYDGEGQVAAGVTVHKIGGHSRGLQAVQVKTANGFVCLASDAAHYWENYLSRKPFPIVVDVEDMLKGFDHIQALGSSTAQVVPGHDPKVFEVFAATGGLPNWCRRLDLQPKS